ncbi:PRKR-interacting protein 1 homolog [Atheta coriaria]|uniref:PRKR-interacting protein 1 homolog n=1 Tax=Dalotia coriaria TaxID=877792 RepID=UPI0031F3598D
MSKIRDEIKREVPSRPHVSRSQADIQRLKLEKLMKNPDKIIVIPEKPKGRGPPVVPDFVRNVMGSSAGAGSGEFHVYRHLRRKEYSRQHYMQKRAEWEQLESDYHNKISENQQKADMETAKKRAKRLKKKQKMKQAKKKPQKEESSSEESSTEESDEDKTEPAAIMQTDTTEDKPDDNAAV